MGRPVLHFQGYEYLKERTSNGRVKWRCRRRKKQGIISHCNGFVWIKNGNIDGLPGEHTHLPPDQTQGKSRSWKRIELIAGVDFCDTDVVKFSNANSKGGSIIMTYKNMQYRFTRYLKSEVSVWMCRKSRTLKCYGYVYFCSKTSTIIKERPHNDKKHSTRFIPSTLGTDDSTIWYSRSLLNTPILHFCGYEYTLDRKTVDGRIRWQCRVSTKKNCRGYVYTKSGRIDGQAREHSHLPVNQPLTEKSKNDRISAWLDDNFRSQN